MPRKHKINQNRFFKINQDIEFNGVPLKQGDVLIIPYCEIKNLTLSNKRMYLEGEENTYHNDFSIGLTSIIDSYPMDGMPFSLKKYIEMFPKITMEKDTPIKIYLVPGEKIYLSEELLARIFLDDCHEGYDWWSKSYYSENPVSFYNGRDLRYLQENGYLTLELIPSDSDDNSTIRLLKKLSTKSEGLPPELKSKLSQKLDSDFSEGQIPDKLKPGLYNITGKETWHLTVIFDKGETLDLSKPEYALLFINNKFLQLLENSSEITSRREKREFNNQWCEGVLQKGIRYYRIKEGISITEITDSEELRDLSKTKISDFPADVLLIKGNYYRIRIDVNSDKSNNSYFSKAPDSSSIGIDIKRLCKAEPVISIAGYDNGKVILEVKQKHPSDVLYTGIMERELNKFADKLTAREATHFRLMEVSRNHRDIEDDVKRDATEYGIKNYLSFKMKAELAQKRAQEYPDKKYLSEMANNYCTEHKKRYWKYRRILYFVQDFSQEAFYLMENELPKNNITTEQVYNKERQALQTSTLGQLQEILRKRTEGNEK